jgi:hypothetical protein
MATLDIRDVLEAFKAAVEAGEVAGFKASGMRAPDCRHQDVYQFATELRKAGEVTLNRNPPAVWLRGGIIDHGCEIFSKARHSDCVGQCAADFC